ncbi:MAG: hypothetical protein K8T25_21810 [Planctomycetia bacterium]|nr:hypothetical protein [Planctomycetia bacterium]
MKPLPVAGGDMQDPKYASLSGRFEFDGVMPPPAGNFAVGGQNCGAIAAVPREELLIDKDRGVANVVVYLLTKDVALPPNAIKPPEAPAVIDNKDCRFQPHVLMMRTGQTLRITNSDPVSHNTMAVSHANNDFNQIIPTGQPVEIKNLLKPERLPFQVQCSIHAFMKGYVVLRDNPFMAVSTSDGRFQIDGLPVGQPLEFQVWHEHAGYVKKVQLDGQAATWNIGRFKKTLQPGENKLGTIKSQF